MKVKNKTDSQINKKKRYKIKFRHKHPILFYLFMSSLLIIALSSYFVTKYIQDVLNDTPEITEKLLKSEQTSNMYDNKGKLIWSETRFRRDYIKSKDIPELYKDLLLSTEDKDFYEHQGFSTKGLVNAGISVVKEKMGKGESRGGSTIEQQLIKYVAFSTSVKDRTIDRKIKELWLAQQLYENYSKDQILEWYINKIDMGENSYGANTAAITYYGKSLKYLGQSYEPENISKLATIAGLGQAPSTYNIYVNPELAQKRRNIVLLSAYNNNKISKAQYDAALKVNVKDGLRKRYWRNKATLNVTKQHSAYVNSVLKQLKELGYNLEKTPMQIYTELDQNQNQKLNNIINNHPGYKDKNQQAASTVIDNNTGIVIAQSGGRNIIEPYALNRATQTIRSSGSTIKPFIDYGPAIEYLGYGTNYKLDSSRYTYPGTNFSAGNFGGYTYGMVDMKFALRQSLNTPAIRLLDQHVGSERAKQFLSNLGLDVKESYGAGDALGLNVSTEQLAAAYAAIGNGGTYHKPRYIDKIIFNDGSQKKIRFESKKAMQQSTAYILAKILEGTTAPNSSATAAKIKEFKGHIVKSGTVAFDVNSTIWRPDTAASDAWMSGATKNISTVVWTGYDVPNKPGNWVLEEQKVRHNLYKEIMRTFNAGLNTSDWKKPNNVYMSGSGLKADYSAPPVENKIDMPNLNINNFGIMREFIKRNPSQVKDSPNKINQIPKDYKFESWTKSIKDDDKPIYNQWLNSDYTTPNFDNQDKNIFHNLEE